VRKMNSQSRAIIIIGTLGLALGAVVQPASALPKQNVQGVHDGGDKGKAGDEQRLEGSPRAATLASASRPRMYVPFRCGESWRGQTRSDHRPAKAIDFNQGQGSDDLKKPVVASAAGTVLKARNLGNDSYGKYIELRHPGGYTTLYAHLHEMDVKAGQKVESGQRIGLVGQSGGAQGVHLHYEQKKNGKLVKIQFNGEPAKYWGTKSYVRRQDCR
jgi:murein DD-endopeptidase MepM/ murein hydrolase activator NlpD